MTNEAFKNYEPKWKIFLDNYLAGCIQITMTNLSGYLKEADQIQYKKYIYIKTRPHVYQ
jgi:hypothetical protein